MWVRGQLGAAAYCLAKKTWKGFVTEESNTFGTDFPPMCITADGKHVVTGHQRGVAVISIDGSDHEILSLGARTKDCCVDQGRSFPCRERKGLFAAIADPQAGGLPRRSVGGACAGATT